MPRTTRTFNLLSFLLFVMVCGGSWFNFVSCSTISPVNSIRYTPASFTSIEAVEPQWQLFADGIDYFYGTITSPRLEFYALKIDLQSPDIGIVVKAGAVNGSNSTSTRVSSFVRDNDLIAGINAVPFDVVSSREGQPIKNMGIVVSGGELFAPVNVHYDALVFYTDGTAAIVSQSSINSTENIKNAVGGFHKILINGEPAERTFDRDARHPRSAAGISADGKYLYLLVIDGRSAGSVGATEKETSSILRLLGSWNGINLDGGGSSALVIRFPDGIRVVNTPVHRFSGQERAVAGCLGIYIKN